jgi:hypothetical protein
MISDGWIRRFAGVLLCVALISSATAVPAAAAEHDDEQFLVELDAEGDADLTVTYTYDLETDSERAAFEELESNETVRQEAASRFQNRMQGVADRASNETGRSMSVTDVNIEVASNDGVGIVTLSVAWENLAAVEGEQLTVTEPFASGFEPNRTFTVAGPDGYEITSTNPSPDDSSEGSVTWSAGTSLDGFEVVAEGSDSTTTDGSDADGAGFGVAVAVSAVVATALARRRT